MPPALQKRIVGLPAWAWIAVVAGGLTIGLILRARRNAEEANNAAYDEDTGDVPSAADPYSDMYTTTGYPNEYYSIPAGAGSGYGGDGYEYLPQIPSWLDEAPPWLTDTPTWITDPPDWYDGNTIMPNAVDPTDTINITVNPPPDGSKSCTKPKPSQSAGKNKKWECRNGKWVAVPKGSSGQGGHDGPTSVGGGNNGNGNGGNGNGGGGNGGNDCGAKPGHPAGHNRHWVCRNGKWVAVQDERAGGNAREMVAVTGGGPPDRRSGHAPPPPAAKLTGTVRGGSGNSSKRR